MIYIFPFEPNILDKLMIEFDINYWKYNKHIKFHANDYTILMLMFSVWWRTDIFWFSTSLTCVSNKLSPLQS